MTLVVSEAAKACLATLLMSVYEGPPGTVLVEVCNQATKPRCENFIIPIKRVEEQPEKVADEVQKKLLDTLCKGK